jgi:hypothetical protein
MLVKGRHQGAEATGDGSDEGRILFEGEAQTFIRHDPGQVLEDAPGMTGHKSHPVGQVPVDVFKRKKIHVPYLRPGVGIEVLPGSDPPAMFVGPGSLSARGRGRVEAEDLVFGKWNKLADAALRMGPETKENKR